MENIDIRRFLNIEPQNSRQITIREKLLLCTCVTDNVISILSFALVVNSGFSINFKGTNYCGKY